jgi:hypothetical protein
MILKKTPKLDSVFFSNNEIELHIASELGNNHFFEVEILVNDVVFDTQSWAKTNDVDCFINLRGQFNNIFTNAFSAPTVIQIVRNDNLFKKITVIVREYHVDSLLIVATEQLPDFYILQNTTANTFDPSETIQLFSELNNLNKIDESSIISIPIWINTTPVSFKIKDNNGLEMFASSETTTKGLYEFKIPILEINTAGLLFITVIINDVIELVYYLKDHFRYEKNQLAIRNVYGFFEFVSFFGKISIEPKYQRVVKENYKDVKSIVEENHDIDYKLNSGYLSEVQRKSVDALNKSKESYFFEDAVFKKVLITTSKALLKETDVFAANNIISFEYNHINTVDETTKYNVL